LRDDVCSGKDAASIAWPRKKQQWTSVEGAGIKERNGKLFHTGTRVGSSATSSTRSVQRTRILRAILYN
jgi:hypothetical protein